MSNYLQLKKMLYIVAVAAMAIVIGFIQIPWIYGFLKLDFSEVVILVAILVLGSKEAMLAAVIRSIIRLIFTGLEPANILGEVLAVIASLSIIFAYTLIRSIFNKDAKPFLYEVPVNGNKINIKEWVFTTLAITLSLTLVLLVINTLFSTPMYYTYFTNLTMFGYLRDTGQSLSSYLWLNVSIYVPFNLVKGASVSIVFLLIKMRLKYLQL